MSAEKYSPRDALLVGETVDSAVRAFGPFDASVEVSTHADVLAGHADALISTCDLIAIAPGAAQESAVAHVLVHAAKLPSAAFLLAVGLVDDQAADHDSLLRRLVDLPHDGVASARCIGRTPCLMVTVGNAKIGGDVQDRWLINHRSDNEATPPTPATAFGAASDAVREGLDRQELLKKLQTELTAAESKMERLDRRLRQALERGAATQTRLEQASRTIQAKDQLLSSRYVRLALTFRGACQWVARRLHLPARAAAVLLAVALGVLVAGFLVLISIQLETPSAGPSVGVLGLVIAIVSVSVVQTRRIHANLRRVDGSVSAQLKREHNYLSRVSQRLTADNRRTVVALQALAAETSQSGTQVGEIGGAVSALRTSSEEQALALRNQVDRGLRDLLARSRKAQAAQEHAAAQLGTAIDRVHGNLAEQIHSMQSAAGQQASSLRETLDRRHHASIERLGALHAAFSDVHAQLETISRQVQQTLERQRERSNEQTRVHKSLSGSRDETVRSPSNAPIDFLEMERRYTQSLLTSRAQIEATINLFAMTPVNAGLPLMGGWAASPDVLITLINELLRLKPVQVVECGSGVSTLWLALTIRRANLSTRVVALEHDPRFASATVETLKRHDVADLVDVRVAPLTAVPISGHPTPWYDCKALNDLHDVGLVFVDGPPTGTGVLARFPAVPLLFERLASPCTIILDDFVRSDEKTIAGKWRELLQDFSYDEMHDLEKGAAIFRRGT